MRAYEQNPRALIAWEVRCPKCDAPLLTPCRAPSGSRVREHTARAEAARCGAIEQLSLRAYEQNPRALTEASEPVEEEEVEYFCGSGYCDDPACTGEHWMEPAS